MALELKKNKGEMSKSLAGEYEKKIIFYKQKIDKYTEEKADISKQAKQLEADREDAQKHSGIFGIAVIFLQIAILLSSIAALLKKKVVWLTGCACGAVGIVYFIDGFLLFF